MQKTLLAWVFVMLFLGCASDPSFSKNPAWNRISIQEFRIEVEEKSDPQDSWHYSGSSGSYYYFFRAPGRKFIGKHSYFEVSKADYAGIPHAAQVPFNGKAVSRSLAFSKIKKDRSGFTHSLAQGLVENVLMPAP